MKFLKCEYEKESLVAKSEIESIVKELSPEIERSAHARTSGYETFYGSINLPFDDELLATVKGQIAKTKKYNPTALVVIGIGGSNLGTVAVHEAVQGLYYNELAPSIKFYSADTVDAQKIADIVYLVSQELDAGKQVVINVVTKSGTTTETMAIFSTFLALLKAKRPADYYRYIVVTTDAGSPLDAFAQKEKIAVLYVPKNVGGRFSVFSAVGLFPLGLLGVDLDQLVAGARMAVQRCIEKDVSHNPAALSAILKYVQYTRGIKVHDMFVFSPLLESVGKWYRQLMGESIGKEHNVRGERVEVGIIPTVSVGTTDLHSVGQLYLGGPRSIFTTFVSIENNDGDNPRLLGELGVKFVPVMNAILRGVKIAYAKNNRPYSSIIMPELSPYYVGQLLQVSMIEIMYLGYLLGVNPFDQPHVELYKKEAAIQLKELRL